MEKFYLGTKIALAICGALFLLAGASTWVITDRVELQAGTTMAHADATLTKADVVISGFVPVEQNITSATSDWSNATKTQIRTFNDVGRDLRATIVKVNRSINNADDLMISTKAVLDNHISPLVDSIKTTSDNSGIAVKKFGESADQVTEDLDDIHTRVHDPQIDSLLKYLTETTQHVDGIAGLSERKYREILYPNACTGKLCKIKTAIGVARGIDQLGEPSYFMAQFIKALLSK